MRPNDEPAGPATVSPGLHLMPDEGGYAVVWWDPGTLHLGATPPFGVRREELIVKDVPRTVVADGRAQYDRWVSARQQAREAGLVPSLVVATVGQWSARVQDVQETGPGGVAAGAANVLPGHGEPAEATASSVAVLDMTAPGDETDASSRGAAFGSLVHAVLAVAPFDSTPDQLDDIASIEARLCGLTAGDAAAAARKVRRVFAHDLLVRARRANERRTCRRETPVTITVADGTLIEGVVDLAFEENGRWIVVDYKTDRELDGAEERYRRQVALYASAVAAATARSASGIIVRV